MNAYTQINRFLSIDTPLGKDRLLLTALHCTDAISQPFKLVLKTLSTDLAIKPDTLVGKEVTAVINEKTKKVFHGMVSQLIVGEVQSHNMREYTLTVVPWLWFLSLTNGRRIFQNKDTKEIIKAVFDGLGFSDYDIRAKGGKRREYCVQYGESDLQFVARLMAEDGFSYYFKHNERKHTLVVVDQPSGFERSTTEGITYSRDSGGENEISKWERDYEMQIGAWTLNDYNFKEPSKSQLSKSLTRSTFERNKNYEHYEYPGVYDYPSGAELARLRMEADEVPADIISGKSRCIEFSAGAFFKVEKHEARDERGEYLLTRVQHVAQDSSYFAGEGGGTFYVNDFVCIPGAVPFRPPVIPRPVMKGPQSAMVTGPAAEEIYIDEHGRIKVQFLWDREGKRDENSSCFLRVMQSWAGNQWGASFIPRIGHEVIVSFLDGDPDRPIVTGTVYNGANKPVYSSKTQSGIKTRSTKGGTGANANELRFEDLKGSEQIFIHAERNLDTEVENDETHTVDHDRTKTVKHDENSTIENDRNKTVNNNQTETIGKDKTISVGNDHSETVDKNMTISVGADLRETVEGSYSEAVTKDYDLRAKTITMQAQDRIVLQTGSAKIVMNSNGDITISGANITVKGSGDVVIKGSKVLSN